MGDMLGDSALTKGCGKHHEDCESDWVSVGCG